MSDGNETIEHRIKAFAQTLLSPQDPQLTIRLVYDLLLCSAFPDKTDAIQAELKSKFIDVQLHAETFRLGFSEAQSGALRRAGNLETIAQIEPTNDDAVACPDNCTDSSEAQLRVPVDQPIENASTTERILRDNTGNRDQEGVSREYSDRQSRQLSLPSSHEIFEASSRQPSLPDDQSRTNAEHEHGDDFHTLNRNGDLPTCVGQDTRPADVLTSTQPRQSKQQERVPGSDPTGLSPQIKPSGPGDEIRYEMQDGILRFLPTENQYQNFSRLIQFARELGAHQTGAVKILVPNCSTHYPLSPPVRNLKALQNRFSIQSRNNGTFEVTRSSRRAPLPSVSEDNADITTDDHVRNFESLLQTPNWFRGVEYYVDLDAHSKEQRRRLGFPPDSPIFPLQGNRLSNIRTAVPGIHTPYAYWSGLKFGAPFAMHVEDCWLSSVNYLYAGEKIWFIVEPQHLKTLEDKLRAETRERPCSQFLRHDASYSTKSCLEEWGVSYKVLSQKPGEIVYTFGRAYHNPYPLSRESTTNRRDQMRHCAPDMFQTYSRERKCLSKAIKVNELTELAVHLL